MTTDLTTLNSVTKAKVETPQLPTIAQNSASQAPESSSPRPVQTENIVRIDSATRQKAAAEAQLQGQQQKASVSDEEQKQTLADSVSNLNQAAQVISRNLEFRVDEASGRTVITVKDSKTDEVIRQIPSDQLLKISARLQELQESRQEDRSASGILFTSQT